MMTQYCPFCKRNPYHYEDVGFSSPSPVAIVCCESGVGLHRGEKKALQALDFMRSPSPKKKARAKKILVEHYCF